MKTFFIWLFLAVPCVATAQFRCTMPNGVVIFKSLSTCPHDAVKVEKLDRVPDSVHSEIKSTPRDPPPVTRIIQKAPEKQPERNIVDDAYRLCAVLKASGATTCDVNVNVFSASYIDATVPVPPKDAQMVCLAAAGLTRKPGSPFVGRGWQLKLFSPLGSGTRPMAQCTL